MKIDIRWLQGLAVSSLIAPAEALKDELEAIKKAQDAGTHKLIEHIYKVLLFHSIPCHCLVLSIRDSSVPNVDAGEWPGAQP